MSRPANVRNPFDWKRSMIEDMRTAVVITNEQCDHLLAIVDQDEREDREQGEHELAVRRHLERERRQWWDRILR